MVAQGKKSSEMLQREKQHEQEHTVVTEGQLQDGEHSSVCV